MKDFSGKTAVITGAASGIGKGLAKRAVQLGCKVVLADIEGDALSETTNELKAQGGVVLAATTDVLKASDVEKLAQSTKSEFGEIHLLFNNAGVCLGINGPRIWERTLVDWEWVLNVNLWGVIYCLHYFLPIMLHQDVEGHIVNTASSAGLLSSPGMSAYNVSKHGVVTLSETLYHELEEIQSKVKVSVLCPGLVRTKILESSRNRPDRFSNDPDLEESRRARYANVDQEWRESILESSTDSRRRILHTTSSMGKR
jgi:NAD(P)-dependent dehydrogenase (short-subunit alcohol dehydrogenase family)